MSQIADFYIDRRANPCGHITPPNHILFLSREKEQLRLLKRDIYVPVCSSTERTVNIRTVC